jgi:hypothetical protein
MKTLREYPEAEQVKAALAKFECIGAIRVNLLSVSLDGECRQVAILRDGEWVRDMLYAYEVAA